MILESYYDTTKNSLNSTIFWDDLLIFFKSMHQNLCMNYTYPFCMIFGKCILFRGLRYPKGMTHNMQFLFLNLNRFKEASTKNYAIDG